MPLFKTESGKDKMRITPKTWTWIKFADDRFFPFDNEAWSIMEVILRVEYPTTGCPNWAFWFAFNKTAETAELVIFFVFVPSMSAEDEVGNAVCCL